MELSEQDKERIKAEEKVRHEAHKEFARGDWGGCCGGHGHGWRSWTFWKGVIVGLVAAWLFCGGMCRGGKFWGCHSSGHGYGMMGSACCEMGGKLPPNHPPVEPPAKK